MLTTIQVWLALAAAAPKATSRLQKPAAYALISDMAAARRQQCAEQMNADHARRTTRRGHADSSEPPSQEPAVQVRTDFRSTILWQPDVITDKNGKATVKVKYPDSLTGWKATARAVTKANQFGIARRTPTPSNR